MVSRKREYTKRERMQAGRPDRGFHCGRVGTAFVLLVSSLFSETPAQGFNGWRYSADLTLNTTSGGAGVSGTVTGFPLLVRLDGSTFPFGQAKGNGEDIRFSKADGATPLPHEIERWDPAAGRADIWVLTDTIRGNSRQVIKMFWGNAGASDASDGSAVFRTDNGFAAVWHLGEDGGAAMDHYRDATANANHGRGNTMSSDSDVPGIAGRAQFFDGVDDYIDCGSDASLAITQHITVSAWINTGAPDASWTGIISNDRYSEQGYWLIFDGGNDVVVFETYNGSWLKAPGALTNSEAGSWIHFCGVFNGSTLLLYKNGAAVGQQAYSGTLSVSPNPLRLGSTGGLYGDYFSGIIDEARVSSTARSSDWIKLSYQNQREGQQFISIQVNPVYYSMDVSVYPGIWAGRTNPAGPLSVDSGGSVQITALPEPGFEFLYWSSTGGLIVSDDSANTVQVGLIAAQNTFLTAHFQYSVALPTVTVANLITREERPDIMGTVLDPFAEVRVSVNGREYSAINKRDGTWVLPGDSLFPLPESDSLPVYVEAVNPVSAFSRDTGILVTDYTPPGLAAFSPDSGDVSILSPTLLLFFDEAVAPGSGAVSIFPEGLGEPAETVNISNSNPLITGWGGREIGIRLGSVLDVETEYRVTIDSGTFLDSAGNAFGGTGDGIVWRFQTLSADDPVIDSITALSSPGIYGIGDTVRFAVHFSHAMSLVSGSARVVLETGSQDRAVSIEQSPGLSAVIEYIVQEGDSTGALNVLLFDLSAGSLVNAQGRGLASGIPKGRNLSDHALLIIDGVKPDIIVVSPHTNEVVRAPVVSYELSERVAAMAVQWKNGIKGGSPLGSEIRIDSVLEGEWLEPGPHDLKLEGSRLEPDASYQVVVTVTDIAGNFRVVNLIAVKLVEEVSDIEIQPGNAALRLGGQELFTAFGVDTEGMRFSIDSVTWRVAGTGSIGQTGQFVARDLGENLVIAEFDGLSDTAVVTVDSGTIIYHGERGGSIQVGSRIRLAFPGTDSSDSLVLSVYSAAYLRPGWLSPAGIEVGFGAVPIQQGGVAVRMMADTSLSVSDSGRLRIYRLSGTGGWICLETEILGDGWYGAVSDTLGVFILGADTVPPTASWASTRDSVAEGTDIRVSYVAWDGIENPSVRLIAGVGGAGEVLVQQLEATQGDHSKTADIPAALVGSRGLFYTIEVSDGVNSVRLDPVSVKVLIRPAGAPGILSPGQYHLFGVPLDLGDRKVSTLFGKDFESMDTTRWRIFHYTGGTFSELGENSEIHAGKAYFVQTRGMQADVDLGGTSAHTYSVSEPWDIDLGAGWNPFSSPFFFSLSRNSAEQPGVVQPAIFQYSGGMWLEPSLIDSLRPWAGYVVWNGPPGSPFSDQLHLHPLGRPGLLKRSSEPAESGRVIVRGAQGPWRDGAVVLGYGFDDATDGRDGRDLPKPDLASGPFRLSVDVPWEQSMEWLTDYRGPLGEGKGWKLHVAGEASSRFTLEFEGLEDLPEGMTSALFHPPSGEVVRLKGRSDVSWQVLQPETSLELVVGTSEFVEEKIRSFRALQSFFGLEQNFPNPFSSRTEILYSIPSTGAGRVPVRLAVFDMHGKMVRLLTDRFHEPGPHAASWDGSDGGGRNLPSGAYFIRLQAGSEWKSVKRTVLMR